MTATMPDHQRVRQQAGKRTFSRRAMLCSATATTLSLAGGARLHDTSAQTPVANSALGELQQRLNGTLLLPDDSGFQPANTPANRRYQEVIPTAIARCADEADVIASVQWCVENGVEPVVRGGGHSFAGYSTTTGLLIDLRGLSGVTLDPAAGTMTVGGGATNAQVFATLDGRPHFLPVGTSPTVGIGGLTLGGGIGPNTRWAGLTCDHLQQTRIVTANGEPLDASSSQHSDLFWALRGGAGGSFGVNTSFTFDLVEVPTKPVTNFSVTWRGADAAGLVIRAFQALMQQAPPEFGAAVVIIPLDPDEAGKRRGIDVSLDGHFIGGESDLQDLLTPLLEVKTPPIKQEIAAIPFWASQRRLLEPEAEAHAFTDISRYANAPLPDDVIQQIVDQLVNCPHRTDAAHGMLTLFGWVGGTLTQTARDATAYVHRDMTALWRPGAAWSPEAPSSVSDELSAWSREVAGLIAPHTPNESYQNFPNREIVDWQQQYYAENFQRLTEVKAAYDPGNVFHNAQSIPVSLST
ncbi:MAG: FAD-binding oxidoreductase [Chloroflexota bacterium]|nr:FAD-binding oxidoreductase [Chloroflexota bacterium]